MPKLTEELKRINQMISNASTMHWSTGLIREDILDRIEASTDSDLRQCTVELGKKFKAWTQPQQSNIGGELFEIYGETLALLEIKERGASQGMEVQRLSTSARASKGLKTPDIKCIAPEGDFYIEIKVLDIAGGQCASDGIVTAAFENNIELESRLKPGVNFGKPLEIAPHGKGMIPHAQVLDNFIRRIASNIKKEQVTVGPTFVLIVDLRIPLDCYDATCLVPAYFQKARLAQDGFEGECVSGDWWQVAFGNTNDLILGESEFEGKGNLKGRQQAEGVLVQHPYLFGLSVLSGMLSESKYRIHTLAQIERATLPDKETFLELDPDTAASYFSDAFNDNRNSHGWSHQLKI